MASANHGPARVKVAPPAAEEFLSVAFSGDVPSQADLKGIKGYLGRYEIAHVIILPAPGKDDAERKIRAAARYAALHTAYGGGLIPQLRDPVDDEEARQLVAGAPRDAGVVFHLRLKKAAVATTTP